MNIRNRLIVLFNFILLTFYYNKREYFAYVLIALFIYNKAVTRNLASFTLDSVKKKRMLFAGKLE